MEKETRIVGVIISIIVIAFSLVFFTRAKESDIRFARKVFSGLINNSLFVHSAIDWDNLKGPGVDAGATYKALPNKKEKNDYRNAFVRGFSQDFKRVGGQFEAFVNWRVITSDPTKAIVAADYQKYNKTLLFIISKGKNLKLSSLQWEQK